MIQVGIAGMGFMGVTHFDAWSKVKEATVSAICTRDEKKLAGDWSTVQGNFGGSGGVRDLGDINRYPSLDDLIKDDRLDLLDLCLPTPMHPDTTVAALEAGRHVLVEKPISVDLADADRMIAAAKASGRKLMVAHVLKFVPQFAHLAKIRDSGIFGQLVALNLRRIISIPDWSKEIGDFPANGGPLIDLHIHDIDFILFLLGPPRRLQSMGREQDGVIVYVSTNYEYANGPQVSCQSGAVSMSSRPFLHEYEACFERATVRFSEVTEPGGVSESGARRTASQVLTIYQNDGSVSYPDMADADGFHLQLQHVADCLTNESMGCMIGAESARDALALAYLEDKSVRSGSMVDV